MQTNVNIFPTQVVSIVFLQIEMVLVRLDSGSITVYYGLMKVHMCFQLCMLGFIEGIGF